jgi:hypothetical protein
MRRYEWQIASSFDSTMLRCPPVVGNRTGKTNHIKIVACPVEMGNV